jgi:putative transposase
MNNYTNNRVSGTSFFFTVRLLDRNSTLLTDYIASFGEAIRQARTRKPFHIDAWVALPDHTHAIWTLPPGDEDCAARWRAVKIAFSKSLRKAGHADGAIWEPQFQHHRVADDIEYAALVDYVHANPLRHGLCRHPADWPWSSHGRFVAAGMIAVVALQTSQTAQG